jgi:tape measure domain-containing protein
LTIRDIAIAIGFKNDEKSKKKSEKGIKDFKAMATKALSAIAVDFSVDGIRKLSEEFQSVNQSIQAINYASEEQVGIQEDIMKTANRTYSSYKDMAGVIGNLQTNGKNFFGSFEEASEFAELTAKFFKISGKSSAEVVALQNELGESFRTNLVSGSTLNKIIQASPKFAEQLAEKYGTTTQGLVALAEQGLVLTTGIRK